MPRSMPTTGPELASSTFSPLPFAAHVGSISKPKQTQSIDPREVPVAAIASYGIWYLVDSVLGIYMTPYPAFLGR